MALTKKQEMFCQEVVKQDTYSAAYRIAYDCSKWNDESVNVEASKAMADPKIILRVNELKKKVEEKALYTIEESVLRDKKLIDRYEYALDVLERLDATNEEVTAAERTIKFISSNGYNSAQERLSKQHGFFAKDNNQKKIADRVIVDMSDYNKDKK